MSLSTLCLGQSATIDQLAAMPHLENSVLKVVQETIIAPGEHLAMHPNRDMEIVSYIISGHLKYQDTMGNTVMLNAGDVQCISAGKGLIHSETNANQHDPINAIQIWIAPNLKGTMPSYRKRHFSDHLKQDRWCLLASGKRYALNALSDQPLKINQDADIFITKLSPGKPLKTVALIDRCAYLYVINGDVNISGKLLSTGDRVAITEPENFSIEATRQAEVLYFNLPK